MSDIPTARRHPKHNRRRRVVPVMHDRRRPGSPAIDRAVAETVERFVFDSLELRRMMAAHVVGSNVSYATIQAAVNAAAAGATVTVDAGTYAETVTLNKRLTLLGAEAGVDARTNDRRETGPETIISGTNSGGVVKTAFYVTANNVTIDGFVVQGVTDTSLSKGAGIVIAPNIAGTTIVNNLVQNNVAGLYLANNSSTSSAVIRHNVFRNNNNDGEHGGRAIYTDQTLSGGKLTNVTIDENAFFFNYGGNNTTHLEAAIAFESGTNQASQTNLNITNNVFDDNGKAVLAINVDGMLFKGNVVTRGRDFYSGIVRFEGNDHNVTITANNLYNNTGPAVAVDVKGFPGDNSGFVVTGNNIYGNGTTAALPANQGKKLGVVINGDAYDGIFDARNNYWGSTNGPSGDGPGTGDSIYGGPGDPKTGKWLVTSTKGSELFSGWATAPIVARSTAFWGTPATDGFRIQAEDFNFGGSGIAYSDNTTGNSSGQYRNTDVDIATTADSGGGYAVTTTAAGEWLDYTVKLAQGGTYRVDLRLASNAPGATVRLYVDGQQIGTDAAVASTGSNGTFATLSLNDLAITSGQHVIRVMFVGKNTSGATPAFNWFQLTNTAAVAKPAAPTGLAATAKSSAQVDLTWTNVAANATGLKVLRSTDGVNFTTVATLADGTTSYSVTALSALTKYTFAVVATNAGGDSAYSNAVSVTTSPAAVTPLTALQWTSATSGYLTPQVNASIKGLTLNLRGTSYATGIGTHADSTIVYNLGGQFNSFSSSVGIDDETAGQGSAVFQVYGDGVLLYSSGTVTGKSAVRSFTLNIKGVQTLTLKASSVSGDISYAHADWAGAVLMLAGVPAPAAPVSLTAAAVSSTSARLAWTAGDGTQTGFKLQRSVDGGVTWATVATTANTSYTDSTLAAKTTYAYRVRAYNASGDSADSANVTVTTPTATTITALASLTWDSATTGYGTVNKNANVRGDTLSLRGTTYASGIGTHADSTITYTLGGQYAIFSSDIGVDDAVNGNGSVVFQVVGDGKVLYDSGLLTGTSPVVGIAVDVTGVQTLQLIVTSGGDGMDYDHADWAGATLTGL